MPPLTRQLVFHGAQSSLTLLVHLTAVGLTLLLIVMLLRYERRLVSKAVGNWLLGLRVAVLAVVLMTLLQPVLSWTLDQKRTGRILIGVDLSNSMATTDVHALRGEKLRWARGLGMIGNAAVDARLDRWQQAFDEGREPEWVDPTETADDERRAALITSRREHLLGIFKDLDAIPRREIARRLLTTVPKPLLDELKNLGRLELFVFAGKTEAVERTQLEKVVAAPSSSLITETSDLSQALQPSGAVAGGDVRGLILFTDGRDLSGKNLSSLAASLRGAEAPVFPVLLGSTFRPKDLSIASLEYPQAVYKGDHPQLKAVLNTVGFEGKTLDVELVREDQPDAEPIKRSVTVTATTVNVEFDLDGVDVGRKAYVIRTPVLEGETRDDNNGRSFAFAVVDDRAKVFLIEGDARWEFRYLEAALARDERVDLKRVLFQQPYLGVLPEPFFPRRLDQTSDPKDPAASPFANIDLVILGDVPPEQLSDATWERIREFVTEGGTLVISPGKRWMPLAYRSPVLDQLLPVKNLKPINLTDRSGETTPLLRGLPVQLTVEGEQQSMLQFAADPIQNQNIWVGLPGQMWMLLGETKPAATVWATTLLPAALADPLINDRKHGLIVHHHFGSGQVLWLGFDGTWRWRHRVGDEYHHRFWAQLARWAAANKVTAGNEFVRFGPEKTDIELGQDATVRAKWMAPFLQKFPKLKAKAELFRIGDKPDKPFTTVELAPPTGRPLQFEGKAVSLPAGEYRVALSTENADLGPKPIEAALYVHDRPSLELSDLSANRDLLTQIADQSGGRLFLADELHELPRQFKTFEETTSLYEESPLWDRWPWLAVLFALMTTEWVIRKLNGLP
ncbi:MAG: hypothetical protein AABP62_26320 [Planctomycetota bacterium]